MTILKMSLMASVLIVLIAIIRMIAINKLPKKVFIILWGIVLCRLIVPFALPSHISFPSSMSNVITDSKLVDILMNSPLDRMTASVPMESGKIIEGGYLSSIPPYVLIWFAGFVLMTTFFFGTHLRYLREYKTALPLDHPFVDQWVAKQSRRIEVRQSDKIISPLTYGIWRPVILLPKRMNYKDTSDLKYVLTHELIHLKQFDTLTKWLLIIALSIHWFNPLVWVMYILANRDIELSCDETVVRTFGECEKSSYAHTLISMAESGSKWAPLYSNFSKNSLEERIVAIMKVKKSNLTGAILAISLVFITMLATTVDSAKGLTSIDLYDHVNALEDVNHYPTNMIEGYSDTPIATTEDYHMHILQTILTKNDVYVMVGLEGNVEDDPDINGRIVSEEEQMVYELDGRFKEIDQEGMVRYFFYTGNIADNVDINRNNLSEGVLLELAVHLNGTDYHLHTEIEELSPDHFIFQPDASNYESDYYETILLTPHGLNMTASRLSHEDRVQPSIKMTIIYADGTAINLSYDSRGFISDEGFPVVSSYSGNPDTGRFFSDWSFHGWELDLTKVEALIIDDITYYVH